MSSEGKVLEMYNRYVPAEHTYTPAHDLEPSQREPETQSDKEKYIREPEAVQGERTNSGSFFRNFSGIEGAKWKKITNILSGEFFEGTAIKDMISLIGLDDVDTGDILLFFIILFLLSEGDELDRIITLGLMLLMGFRGDKKCPEEDPSGH